MMRIAILGSLLSVMLCGQTGVTLVVPGSSNPYLAGMPDGTKAQKGDTAPEVSPVLVNLSLAGATAITFTVSGEVSHGPMWPAETPEGSRVLAYRIGSEHGIAGVVAPFESLMGVFLDDRQPDRSRAPRALTFRTKDREFTTLHPQLKQVFFIGSGMTKSGAIRRFSIPPGATRLFLGTMDGYDWYNNTGSFRVTATLESPRVTSNMFSVDSGVVFAKWDCLPDHLRCTPARPMIEAREPGLFHVLLPAQLEWGASIPNPAAASPVMSAVKGTVCLDRTPESCSGPASKGDPGGAAFVMPSDPAGALVVKTSGGRTWFSVNDRSGSAFERHDGFFEFDVSLR